MQLQRLRQFAVVAQEGSIVGASAKLRLAQPALSRQMRALERDVGATLFNRERRGVRLTPAGEALLARTEELLTRLDLAVRATMNAHRGSMGQVRLGVGRMALDDARVARAIGMVRNRYPGIRLDVAEVPSLDQARALRARELDVAVGLADFEGDALVRREVLYEERMDAALVATSHPVALRGRVDVDEMRQYLHLTLRRPVYGGYPRMYDALRTAGIEQVEEHETAECVLSLVAAGRGWSMASRQMLAPPAGTTVVPVTGIAFSLPVSLRWRGNDRSKALANVVHVLRDACTRGEGGSDVDMPRAQRDDEVVPRVPETRAIELSQLLAFIAAVEEGSLSGAAVRLRLTQSGVSRRVLALERALRCRLVVRATHGVHATDAGAALKDGADQVLRLAELAVARARQAAGGISGLCRIGALPPELTGGFQAVAMRRVVEECPKVRIELAEMLPERQIEALLAGRIDIAVSGTLPGMTTPPDLSSVHLVDDVIDGVLLPEGHALAARAWITAAELAAEPFLFIERGRDRKLYDAVTRALAELGLTGAVPATHSGPRAIWRAAAGGVGWSVATRAQRARPPAGLVGVPVEGLNIPWNVSLYWRRRESDASVRAVLQVFRTTRNSEVAVVVATVRAHAGGLRREDYEAAVT